MPGGLPIFGALWVPEQVGVAIAGGAADGVPGHPAIGGAIDDNGLGFVAFGEFFKIGLEIVCHGFREGAGADIW